MSELLAILSNPRGKKGHRKGARRGKYGRFVKGARKAKKSKSVVTTMKSVITTRRGYRGNPRGISVQGLGADLMAATAGAVGGIALDLAMRPLPLAIKSGPVNHLVRGAASIGLGLLAQSVRMPFAGDLARGAMSITLYNAARQYVLLPRGLGELSDDDIAELSALNPVETVEGVGEYMPALAGPEGIAEYQLGNTEAELSEAGYVED
jgi:hypothetical protein